MATANKYATKVVQDGLNWTADITRRVSRKDVVVSKTQAGFATEAEAQAWADTELKAFVENQEARNKRHNEKRGA
ncbi:MAG: DUF3622 domain-containing protein [Leucothrix sp.]